MLSNNIQLLKRIHQTLVKPSTIWWLPVSYSLSYLPQTIWLDSNEELCREVDQNTLHKYWHSGDGLNYNSVNSEAITIVEVRPFLVISDFDFIVKTNNLGLPKWYSNAVAGFPITKIENLRSRKDIKFNVDKFINGKEDIDFLQYIPKTKQNGLQVDSYIALTTPTFSDIEFFSQKLGSLEDVSFNSLKDKLAKIFVLQKG